MTRTYADGIEDAARVAGRWVMVNTGIPVEQVLDLEAAIRTLSPSPSGIEDAREALTGWQAIHAAIRDEQPRLLLMRDGRIVVGFWSSWNSYWTNGQSDRMSDHVMIGNPTHFMPLPAPPLPESASSKIGGDHG